MYKAMIAKKIGLRTTFPRAILYKRQNAIGIGLITPKIIIAMLACKLYIGNIRAKSRMNKLIQYHKESIMIENGVRECKEHIRLSNNQATQYEEIQEKLQLKQLMMVNRI